MTPALLEMIASAVAAFTLGTALGTAPAWRRCWFCERWTPLPRPLVTRDRTVRHVCGRCARDMVKAGRLTERIAVSR